MSARRRCMRVCLLLIAASCGCNALPEISWERMAVQARGKAYRASPFFGDGRLMQTPPEGTLATNAPIGPDPRIDGFERNEPAARVPLDVDRALLLRGQNRFDTICAVCHGLTGDGTSVVAESMTLRRPPSLVTPPVRDLPPGQLFRVITYGYGLMPSYATVLPIEDRWAIVAYLPALARSQSTALSALPPRVRQQAMEALR